ncbi:hypothetical protein UlMin_046018 [Ulmus minor]
MTIAVSFFRGYHSKFTLHVNFSKADVEKYANRDRNFVYPRIDNLLDIAFEWSLYVTLFSVLLSLLRTGNLPSKARDFDLQDLIFESKFYGIKKLLVSSMSNPSQFEAKITSFDWSLRKKKTILTQFTAVDSMLAFWPSVVAAGATDFSWLQILDLENGIVKETLNWENVTKSSSTVQAIGSSPELLFVSFESGRRNSNSILVYDLHSLSMMTEVGHNEIFGADIDSALPATKLNWLSGYNLLMASGSHSGPTGVLGNIKFWDIRSGCVAWELKEDTDCFSDITVSDNLSSVLKVGVNSGEVFLADLRKFDEEKPWVRLGDDSKVARGKKEGYGCKIESHGSQNSEDGLGDRVFRKNLMGKAKDLGGSRITNMAFGGNKMFVTRKDQQNVEVS